MSAGSDSPCTGASAVVMGSRMMSVSVVSVVVTATCTDEEDEPVVTVASSVSGAETDVSVFVEGVELSGRSCACMGGKYEKNMPTRAIVVVNVLVFIETNERGEVGHFDVWKIVQKPW